MPRLGAMRLLALVLAAAAGAALLLRSHDSSPSAPPRPVSELFSVPVSGGQPRLLLRVRYQLADPAFDRDGSLLLLRPGLTGAQVVSWRGGDRFEVVSRKLWTFTEPFAWSPDRRRVAISTGENVRIVSRSGRVVRELAHGSFGNPSWSEDGRTIAFTERSVVGDRWLSRVWVVGPGGGKPRLVLADRAPAGALAVAPEGDRMVVGVGAKAFLVDIRTRARRLLPIPRLGYAGLAWSPDGRLLAHQTQLGVGVLDVTHGRDRLVARRGYDAVFDPAGRRILFLRVHPQAG